MKAWEERYWYGRLKRENDARKECARRGIDPDEVCADGGVTAWMVIDQELQLRYKPNA